MKLTFWKAMAFAMFVLGWLKRSSEDGIIDEHELLEVIREAVEQFDLNVAIKIPADK